MGVKAPIPLFRTIPRLLLIVLLVTISGRISAAIDAETAVARMEGSYAGICDYRAEIEVKSRDQSGSFQSEKFVYTFKKPNRIRLDFKSPYRGTVLIYPDKRGKVLVRPWGWTGLFEFRLAPDGFLLRKPSGQRIDQTDMGLLIKNISRSIKEDRRGPVEIVEEKDIVRVQVLAENHFSPGRLTQYTFSIDKDLWLPVVIEESSPGGTLERIIYFRNLRVNVGVPDSAFELERG